MSKQQVTVIDTDAHTETKTVVKAVQPLPLTARQERFAVALASGMSASDAYMHAYNAVGSTPGTIRVAAHRTQHHPRVAAHVRELMDAAGAVAMRDTRALVRDLEAAVDADPSELVQLLNGACRRCWGAGNKHEWASVDEFVTACEDVARHNDGLPPGAPPSLRRPMPDVEGGFTYTFNRDPNPDCVGCGGIGINRVKFNNTADASPGARRLVKGFECYPDGTVKRLHLADQTALRIELHRLRGLHVDRSVSLNLNATLPKMQDLSHDEAMAFLDRIKPLATP